MALELPFGVQVLNPLPLDAYYYASDNTPWASTAAVTAGIPSSVRYQGMTVNIAGTEYWFAAGITDLDLVAKGGGNFWKTDANTEILNDIMISITPHADPISNRRRVWIGVDESQPHYSYIEIKSDGDNSINLDTYNPGTASITGFNFNNAVVTLSINGPGAAFNISDGRVGAAAVGIQYDSDLSATFTARSLVDKGYVDAAVASAGGWQLSGSTDLTSSVLINSPTGSSMQFISFDATTGILISESSIELFGWGSFTVPGTITGQFLLTDNRPTKTGIEYAADYSATFTSRSLVDKAYVDSVAGGGFSGSAGQVAIGDGVGLIGDDGLLYNTTTNLFQVGGQSIFTHTSAATNTVSVVHALVHSTTGVPAIGLGTSMTLAVENSSGTTLTTGEIQTVYTNLAAGNEYADFVIKNLSQGSLLEAMRLVSTTGKSRISTTFVNGFEIVNALQVNGATRINNSMKVGIYGDSTIDRRLHVEENSTSTNLVLYPLRLTAISNTSTAPGIGTGIELETETQGGNMVGATIESISTDVGVGVASFDLVFKTMVAGAAASEHLRMGSNKIGFFAVTPVVRQVIPTGSTTDQVITALQNLGLFSQT